MAGRSNSDAELQRLRAENRRLKAQLSKPRSDPTDHHGWKVVLMVSLIGLAAALLVVGNLLFWSARTIVKTDSYVEAVGPVVSQPAVQEALAKKTTSAIFQNIDVERIAQEALPPKADFLAKPLTTQLQTYTEKTLQQAISSEKFATVWVEANTRLHERLYTFVKDYEGDGTIEVNDLYQKVTEQLQGTKLAFLANKQLPANIGNVTITDAAWLPTAHWVVNNLMVVRVLTILLFLALSVLAVWLSKQRRRMVLRLTVLYAVMLLASLLAVRIARAITVDRFASEYQQAVREIWDTISHGFLVQTWTLVVVFGMVALVVWITGNTRRAAVIRGRIEDLFAGKLHQSIFGNHENAVTKWFGSHKKSIEYAILVLGFVVLLFVPISPVSLVVLALIIAALELLVEFIAQP